MTENKQNLVPEIRFNGFTNAWEKRKLGEVYKERKERGIDSLPILSVSIHHGVSDEELNGHKLGKEVRRSDDKSLYKRVYAGDLVINMMRAWQGAIGVVKSDGMVSPAYITAISNSHVYPLFMDFYLRRDEPIIQMDNLSQGVTDFRKRLYWDSFIDITCQLPSLLEQERISDFFHTFNNTITLHKRKLSGLRELRKGYLQQMFPQAGERVPRVRFGGFSGEWKDRKLGDISMKVLEKNKNNQFSETFTNSAEHGIISQRDFFDKDISNSKNLGGYFIVSPDDFVYNPRISNFASVGPIKRNRLGRTGVMSPLYYIFRVVEGDLTYIEKYFESVYWHEFMKMNDDNGVRSDRFNIKDSVFEEMPVPFPSVAEQTVIGNFFRNLDEQITAQAAKLEQLQQLKTAYLKKMFI